MLSFGIIWLSDCFFYLIYYEISWIKFLSQIDINLKNTFLLKLNKAFYLDVQICLKPTVIPYKMWRNLWHLLYSNPKGNNNKPYS